MSILTAEKIAELTDGLYGVANIRAINKLYREQDESHLWPINSKFNATDRAIYRARKLRRDGGCPCYGLEYCYQLEGELSDIVNNESNW